MDVGVSIIFQNKERFRSDYDVYQNEIKLARLAEPLGFDSLWTVEHHFTDYTMTPDPLQFLAFMAGQTQTIKLGSMVMVLPWHKPVKVAENVSMLDNLSGGRVILGIGRGIGRIEYEGMGVDQNQSREIFVESANAVLGALETGQMEIDGEHFTQLPRDIRPEPFKSFRDRTYAAAISPESSQIMADLGVGILVIPQKKWEEHAADLANYRARFLEMHQQPAPAPIAACWVVCHEDEQRAQELARTYLVDYYVEAAKHYEFGGSHFQNIKGHEQYAKWAEGFSEVGTDAVADFFMSLQVYGTPDQCYEQIMEIRRKFGNNTFVGVFSYGNMPYDEADKGMRLFAEKVLPRLKQVGDVEQDAA